MYVLCRNFTVFLCFWVKNVPLFQYRFKRNSWHSNTFKPYTAQYYAKKHTFAVAFCPPIIHGRMGVFTIVNKVLPTLICSNYLPFVS